MFSASDEKEKSLYERLKKAYMRAVAKVDEDLRQFEKENRERAEKKYPSTGPKK